MTQFVRRKNDAWPLVFAGFGPGGIVVPLGYLKPVFTNSGPLRKSNFLRRVHRPLLEEAGLPYLTFHRLRHIFTTPAILAGENIAIVNQGPGPFFDPTTVDRYGHLQSPDAQRSIAALGDRLYGSTLKLADE